MKPSEHSGKNERSQVDPLVPVEPQIGPRIGQAGEESHLSFDFECQGHGRRVKDKEEKIDEYRLAFGIDVAVEKYEERGKRVDHHQGHTQYQAVFRAAIHAWALRKTRSLLLPVTTRVLATRMPLADARQLFARQ